MLPTITRSGGVQTTPAADSNGTFECVWSNPYVLSIPTDWVSGIFLARLTGSSTGLQSYIIFLVRDDSRSSTFLYQSCATTYEAYNNWPGPNAGGKSLYSFNSVNSAPAVKVSFNRPYNLYTSTSAYFNQVGAGFFLSSHRTMFTSHRDERIRCHLLHQYRCSRKRCAPTAAPQLPGCWA